MTKNELGTIIELYNKPIAQRNAEKLRKTQGTGWTEKPGETWNNVIEVYYHDVTLRSFSLPEEKAEVMTVLKMVFNHDEKVIELLFFRDQYKWEFYKYYPGLGLDEIGWGLEPRKGFRSEGMEFWKRIGTCYQCVTISVVWVVSFPGVIKALKKPSTSESNRYIIVSPRLLTYAGKCVIIGYKLKREVLICLSTIRW